VSEEVGAGFGGQSSHELSDAAAKCLSGALGTLAQECLEGAVGHLDWIEVRRVRWQIAQSRAGSFDRFAHTFDLVNADIVHHHDVATFERRYQELIDIGQNDADNTIEELNRPAREAPEYQEQPEDDDPYAGLAKRLSASTWLSRELPPVERLLGEPRDAGRAAEAQVTSQRQRRTAALAGHRHDLRLSRRGRHADPAGGSAARTWPTT
jgi:hypothetical protein